MMTSSNQSCSIKNKVHLCFYVFPYVSPIKAEVVVVKNSNTVKTIDVVLY